MNSPRRAATALLLSLVAVAVSFVVPASPAAAAAGDIVLTGRVVAVDGTPIRHANVRVDDGTPIFVEVLELLACWPVLIFDQDACLGHSATAKTDRSGRFRIAFSPTSNLGKASVRHIAVWRGQTRFSGSFTSGTVRLPDVALWTSVATFRRDGEDVIVTETVPPGLRRPHDLRVSGNDPVPDAFDLRVNSVPAWYLHFGNKRRTRVDAHVFEKSRLRLSASTTGRWSGRHAEWSSGVTVPPRTAVPTSRGISCSTYTKTNLLVEIPGCSYTDGRLGTPPDLHELWDFQDEVGACRSDFEGCIANALVFDLGELSAPTAVVVRNCSSCGVELSLDGQTWMSWRGEQRTGTDYAVLTGDLHPARYVRVRGGSFMLWHLTQVSIWSDPLLTAVMPGDLLPSAGTSSSMLAGVGESVPELPALTPDPADLLGPVG